ncbi:MAG TPA: protein-L-isoaspartate(D-aspartate) O-methyltransferase [Lysobacter sp.]|nr:protein-L-isoaspartate(D-aspartate) O-methyltransferase [Lysobacter sp.]
MPDYAAQREQMVQRQIARRGVLDPRVLEAMRRVPREQFVDAGFREFAYADSPLPIEHGQTISQPYIVAVMLEAAQLSPGDRALEIGAGSGYAAAVMAAIAGQVFAIERHPQLTECARERFERLGYTNIVLRSGDGSGGWPEHAPFDAIIAAAGAPSVPAVLREQLKVGGRLVLPVGDTPRRQRLLQITRTGQDSYEERELGDVLFVPLVGEHGWAADDDTTVAGGAAATTASAAGAPGSSKNAAPRRTEAPARDHTDRHRDRDRAVPLSRLLSQAAEPLPAIEDPGFAAMFDRYADARVVLLGEASHGTSEFYRARAAITRRLVEHHDFDFVAVEADWPDAAAVDRDVRQLPARDDAEPPFERFPTWMWRNVEVDAFLHWLRDHNAARPLQQRAGFHGLDLYSLGRSIRAVVDYLDEVDPDAAQVARARYSCIRPWAHAPAEYGRMALTSGYSECERAVVAMLREMMERQVAYSARDGAQFFDAAQNARQVRSAEQYYRVMYYGAAESWNLRDSHMFETLEQLLASRGPGSKAVVWAHNSHIGDARHTEMGRARDELNLGQLCRERFGKGAALIGFGTHGGTVAAAENWDEPMQVMVVNPSLAGSYELLSHEAGIDRFLLDLRGVDEALREQLEENRLERFIGVIYRPHTERWSHYAQACLPRQFDAWVWFDHTTAVTPLPTRLRHDGSLETYPFGL